MISPKIDSTYKVTFTYSSTEVTLKISDLLDLECIWLFYKSPMSLIPFHLVPYIKYVLLEKF